MRELTEGTERDGIGHAGSVRQVKVHKLELYADTRGWLMPMTYKGMGHVTYVYATACWPGVVKAWHRHAEHTDRMACVQGMARVVVCRTEIRKEPEGFREGGPQDYLWSGNFQEFVIGPLNPQVVVIPPGWWHGFMPVGNESCIIINAPDAPYDPDDEERLAVDAIPFEWRTVDG